MVTLYTVGHSTHQRDEFAGILGAYSVRTLVDIRTIPRSRRNPQYDKDAMPQWLSEYAIDYIHCGELGGLRHPLKGSINTGWKNDSFRGYADYMQSEQFETAIDRLIGFATQQTTAIMCAEAVPWRCHRSLVGDALLVRGVDVQDIMHAKSAKAHVLTAWARVDGVRITYPAERQESLVFDA